MQPTFLGLSAVGWNSMTHSWWEKVLAGFVLGTVVFGSLYFLYLIGCKFVRYWKGRHQLSVVPTAVSRYLAKLVNTSQRIVSKTSSSEQIKSFGVYLGGFSNPPTSTQACILSQWNVVVLNSLQDGVLEALAAQPSASNHVLGRLDIRSLVRSEGSADSNETIRCLDILSKTLNSTFKRQRDIQSPFTGVLLADCHAHFQPVVLNEVAKYINALGLDVWLELSPPDYLSVEQCRGIDMKLIEGIIYRNGTILSDGGFRDYFLMTGLRATMRAVAAHRVKHGPPMVLWETVEDAVEVPHAILQRAFNWCRFNSAALWIGPRAALTDAEIAAAKTVTDQPLGGLMWLKDETNMAAHEIWRSNDKVSQRSCGHAAIYNTLNSFIPDLASKLSLLPPSDVEKARSQATTIVNRFEWPSATHHFSRNDPLSVSSTGEEYTGLGCFQIGLDCTSKDFTDLAETQHNLRGLDLLLRVKADELHQIAKKIETLQNVPGVSHIAKELLELLTSTSDDDSDRLQVHVGLHSGYRTSTEAQFWGFYDEDVGMDVMNIYLSAKTRDRAGTILHTFMSSRGCTRSECFMAEVALSEKNGTLSEAWGLPKRIVQDIEQLSPTETILFLQRLVIPDHEENSNLLSRLRACCEYQLIEVPSLTQLRLLGSYDYLRGAVSAEKLVTARLAWLADRGCWHPDPAAAIALFQEVDHSLPQILLNNEEVILEQIGAVIRTICQKDKIDASADIFALAIFCAFRKLSVHEIYLECLDRNPLPNMHPDQAAVFAENFAVGSRCDSFFDMTPKKLGKIISDLYRVYYQKNQPIPREEAFTELPTSYTSMKVDLVPSTQDQSLPFYYKVTFLGIFAVPALIDIMLLTTVGRGLYLTTFMTSDQKTMATTALMLALLVCGAVGSWISSGGSYYFYAMAFPAMNMFVLTRFVAGLAITITVSVAALIAISVIKSITIAFVFIFYFSMLSIYLMTLAALSIYQLPGDRFQSGRTVIMRCLPILLVSPILTLFIQNDLAVYFCVLTTFLLMLLLGARKTISQWSTWHLRIPFVTDIEVVTWYVEQTGSTVTDLSQAMRDVGATPVPRKALHDAVLKEENRGWWTKATKDPLVKKLADGYSATMFLMVWYSKHRRTEVPLPYSATWNLQLKAGLENLSNMQKGLKLHTSFLHWRHTGAEVWSGLLYFVVALLDKWAALVSGGALVGLSAASSAQYRLAVGFGLCYYLIGAVSLDTVSQPLWTLATKTTAQPITSLDNLRQVTDNDSQARRALYWKNLVKFLFLHIWGVSITAALMWTFEGSKEATTMYLAYIGAYTGLLWYQYNKIFTGPRGAESLTVAAIIGLPTGIVMHMLMPHFAFSGVISLSVGTWVSAIHSIWISNIGWSKKQLHKARKGDNSPVSHFSSALEPYPFISQSTLSKTFDSLAALPVDLRYTLDPAQHPGVEVMEILRSQSKTRKSDLIDAAFPSADYMLQRTAELWKNGEVVVELVSSRHFPEQEQKLRTLTRKIGDRLHMFVSIGLDLVEEQWTMHIQRNCKIIAEAMVQAICETRLGLSHDHSMLAEILAVSDDIDDEFSVPEGIKRQLEVSKLERRHFIKNGDKIFLRYLLLGIDCEKDWDLLPKNVRMFLLQRAYGQSCQISQDQADWIGSTFCANSSLEIDEHVARCNLGATLAILTNSFAKVIDTNAAYHRDQPDFPEPYYERLIGGNLSRPGFIESFKFGFYGIKQKIGVCVKFLILSLAGDGEYQRELNYSIRGQALFIHWPVTFFLNGIWSFCKALQQIVLPFVLFHGRESLSTLHRNMKGNTTVVEKRRIVVESLNGPSTCFFVAQTDGTSRLYQYTGRHVTQPSESKQLTAVNTYTGQLVLVQREDYKDGNVNNLFTYDYEEGKRSKSKLPIQRQCHQGNSNGQIVQYDKKGYIVSGSDIRGTNPVQFKFGYRKGARFEDELLRAEYTFPHITIQVSWCVPPRNHAKRLEEWIPYSKVIEATFIQDSEVYHAKWIYEHKFHPIISTTLNGEPVATPRMIEHDWFHVLQKPTKCSFLSDNPITAFSSVKPHFITRMLGLQRKVYPISTSRARTHLWKTWRSSKDLDAVTARWLDETLLRSDSVLNPYWRNRDFGRLDVASAYLDAQINTIMARVDIEPDVSSWTHQAFKISDLASFGLGGDARINTRTLSSQLQDNDNELHILAMDTATWPNEPGGVSACRRDMVNDLKTIKWHIISENANDYGVPRFQIERNVQSLTFLPQWGLDFLNPTHGVFQNCLDSEIVAKSHSTSDVDIEQNFVPILTSLVRCARTINPGPEHIEEATKALVDLNTYFESTRNWNDVWKSDVVKMAWRELWLTEDIPDSLPVSQWWNAECPSMFQLDQALDMWCRYLFIFSIPVPEKIPDVFQASHHFTGATYGVICKAKRQCTLHVWDHCISFREMTVFMSSAVSFDYPFINSSLLQLGYLACLLIEHHADVVLPCCDYFNPGWEVELGTSEGVLEHRQTFARKIDPVVNGICNMEKFEPIKTIKTETPTVIMLSHVQFVKDIKNAIMATDYIVNKWGFTDYRLHIYGDMERAASHSTECQELIASKGLQEHCILKGLGNPSVVLQDAWLFLNSSISEGLPLAMGEAALTGVPVVCTDVGASFCVVTDRQTGKRFSSVVPPNDSESLARAQLSVMGLLGEWAPFGGDPEGFVVPKLGLNPKPEEVKEIQKRIYEKQDKRRQLGMLGRTNVLKNFSADRYLREHEQMLWIGKYRSQSYWIRTSAPASSNTSMFFKEKTADQIYTTSSTPVSWEQQSLVSSDKGNTITYSTEV